ncbi:hypothetical protein AGMMS50212_07160 [Spirochaetia bacterium]|nr:hypothetical protein AGMMS50212_07160 [Spirochaetia bacterium]
MPKLAERKTKKEITLADLNRQLYESRKEWDRQVAAERKAITELRAELEKQLMATRAELEKKAAESRAELEKSNRELNKKMGDLGITLGDITEFSFNPDVVMQKFCDMGYELESAARDVIFKNEKNERLAEVDILLQNGKDVIFVEIKTKAKKKDIDELIERIRIFHTSFFTEKRIVGAIAGSVIPESVKNYALNQGIYVIEQTGETIKIEPQTNKFKPQK